MKKILYMAEGAGMYTKGFKEKQQAVDAMRKDAQHEHDLNPYEWSNYYKFAPSDITLDTVKETWYYQHRSCESESIGDENDCYECGEPCGTGGRRTFAFISDNWV